MRTFATGREAKEFLISCIVTQAQRQGIPLSETERKMLYFSETGWTLPDMMTVSQVFDREYDQHEYEQKIGMLSRSFCNNARNDSRGDLEAWNAALSTLRREDHYLLVLVAAGDEGDSGLTMRVALRTVAAGLGLVALYALLRSFF